MDLDLDPGISMARIENDGHSLYCSFDDAKKLRDLLNREFPPMRPCKCQVTQEQERLVGTEPIPELDAFNAETWRLDAMDERAIARRRERIATAVLPSLVAADTQGASTVQNYARDAVSLADALIAALDEPKP